MKVSPGNHVPVVGEHEGIVRDTVGLDQERVGGVPQLVEAGAGTGSLVTVMLCEAVVIGVVGGGFGIALAVGAIDPFVEALGTSLRGLPRQGAIGLDGGVLLFSLAATITTTLAASLGPTLASARRAPATGIGNSRGSGSRGGARGGQRLLLATQSALTVVLVCTAGLLARSLFEAVAVDMGMDTDRVAVLKVKLETRYDSVDEFVGAQEDINGRVAAIPSVSAVGLTTSLPSQGGVLLLQARPENTSADWDVLVTSVFAGEGYFDAVGIQILSGRALRREDGGPEAEGAVISESLAAQFFGRVDVVGRHIVREADAEPGRVEIVGVVRDARQLSPFQDPTPALYYSVHPSQSGHFYVVMAVDGDPGAVLETAREAALSADAALEVERASTLRLMLLAGMSHIRLRMLLMASLATLAGILAMIGISGVVAHYLSEQMRDVGIRMALGAAAPREVARVVRHALGPTVLGVGVGVVVVVAVASSRVMESFVFGIEPTDPITYAAVTAVMLLTAGLAACVPARRAAAVDPARVLKGE